MERVITNKTIEQVEFEADYKLKVRKVLSILQKIAYADRDGKNIDIRSLQDKDFYETFIEYKYYHI